MELRERTTGNIITDSQFRALHPNTSFPQVINYDEWGYDVIFEGPQATGGTVYEYSMRSGVQQIDGKWYTRYVLGPIFTDTPESSAEEQEALYRAQKYAERASVVRANRNVLLTESDWTQGKDIPDSISTPWATYRQGLRDLPDQEGFPWDVTWPEKPV